ncbi:hypothetical protein [Castellaniella sp.]|uniref:hypothetical protein n=1 Tax=Castellaniella sp. TaxID=1955812 RepID=UPI002AFFB3DC|nr:hypothetical protein [Castellaniella sp.]
MPTESNPRRDAAARQLERMVCYFESTGARIALLARSLGLPLRSPSEVDAVLQDDAADNRAVGPQAVMRDELRALLLMRYQAITQMAHSTQVGPPATRDILLIASHRLQQRGFAHDAPGLSLQAHFDDIEG